MADEKKINSAEIMSDEELGQVAGGNFQEGMSDLTFFRDLGVFTGPYPGSTSVGLGAVRGTTDTSKVQNIGDDIKVAWAKVGIVVIPVGDNGFNEYYDSKGNQISRGEALKFAVKKLNSKINYLDYLV